MKLVIAAIGALLLLQEQQTLNINVNLRELSVSVRDQEGRFVTGLQASDFIVEENGVPLGIVHFELDSQDPVSFGILIDNRKRFFLDNNGDVGRAEIQGENPAFFSAMAATKALIARKQPNDEVVLMSFSSSLQVEQDFTASADEIGRRLQQMKPSQRVSQVRNSEITTLSALELALNKMNKAKEAKRILIVFSAWFKEGTSTEINQIKERIGRRGTVVYGFGIEGEGVTDLRGPILGTTVLSQVLNAFAAETGGLSRMFGLMTPPEQSARATEFVQSVQSDLRRNFVIGYYTGNPDPTAKHETSVRTISTDYRVDFVPTK